MTITIPDNQEQQLEDYRLQIDQWVHKPLVQEAYERYATGDNVEARMDWLKSNLPERAGYIGHGSSNQQEMEHALMAFSHWGANTIETLHLFIRGVGFTPWSNFYAEDLVNCIAAGNKWEVWNWSPSINYIWYLRECEKEDETGWVSVHNRWLYAKRVAENLDLFNASFSALLTKAQEEYPDGFPRRV